MAADEPSPNGRRLNGWKDIAAYFDKSVRTVQRWEKTFGLPVHRIGTGGGEIVFAFTAELAAWLQTAEALAAGGTADSPARAPGPQPPVGPLGGDIAPTTIGAQRPAPRAWSWPRLVAVPAACIGVLLLALFTIPRWVGPRSSEADPRTPAERAARNPHHLAVADGKLRAFAADGHRLWDATFDPPLASAALDDADPNVTRRRKSVVADVDGDGRNEVLLARCDDLSDTRLYCLEWDGSRRFATSLGKDVQYGHEVFRAPFVVAGIFITQPPKGPASIWAVATHHMYFPSVLARLNARGDIVSQYWSNGHITALVEASIRGQESILVGACDNEVKGGSLAVFDERNVSGAAPAHNPYYACQNCGAGAPGTFLVFPPSALAADLGGSCTPVAYLQRAATIVTAVVNQAASVVLPPDPQPLSAITLYSFGPDLSVVRTDVADGYAANQRRLERIGRVTARSRFDPDRAVYPVLIWAGDRFVPFSGPKP